MWTKLIRLFIWSLLGFLFINIFLDIRFLVFPLWALSYMYGVWGYVWATAFYLLFTSLWYYNGCYSRKNVFRVVAIGMSVLAGFAMLEVGVRVISPPPKFHGLLPAYPNLREERSDVNLRGVSQVMRRTTNEWGLRGEEPPRNWKNSFTILAIGGSTTQCFYLDDSRTWPHLLQTKLRSNEPSLWIGNAGFDGHSSYGHLFVMEHIVRTTRPRGLLFLVGINDLALSLSEDNLFKGRSYDQYRYQVRKGWMDRSRVFQLLYLWKQILVDEVTVIQGSGHGNFIPTPINLKTSDPLPKDLREVLPSLSIYHHNLIRIIGIARELNCKSLFLTQPMLFKDTPYWRSIVGKAYWIQKQKLKISATTFWRMLQVFNQELQAVCKKERVPCYDLAANIPHDPKYFYDAVHFTEAGTELVADHIAGAVKTYWMD